MGKKDLQLFFSMETFQEALFSIVYAKTKPKPSIGLIPCKSIIITSNILNRYMSGNLIPSKSYFQ